MNDAHRDAWLREALRHAPDADALPPSDVSDAILAQARAAARATAPISSRASSPAPRATAHPSAFAAFWAWLARPPVAAGFASVMAATLIGLMWWDRPLDQTLPGRPEASRAHSEGATSGAPAPSAAAAPIASPQGNATEPAAQAPAPATTEDRREESTALKRAPDQPRRAAAGNAVLDAKRSGSDAPASARRTDALAKSEAAPKPGVPTNDDLGDRATGLAARESPAPFPAAPAQPAALPAPPATLPPPAPRASARKDAEAATSTASADAAAAPTANSTPAPRDDSTRAREKHERAFGGPSASALRQRGENDIESADKQPNAFGAAPPAAEFRGRAQRSSPLAAAAPPARGAVAVSSPLGPVLAAIAGDPGRWSRQTAGGERVALDTGWRDWIGALDAAAGSAWRGLSEPSAATENEAARAPAMTTLQLVEGGRLAASIRLEGTTVRIDASPGSGIASGQATLTPAAADRLRRAAELLTR